MPSICAFIALGSNLGDRRDHLNAAIDELRSTQGIEILAVSDFIETEPVGPPGQGRYLNAAAAIRTSLSARELLDRLLTIEQTRGRDRTTQVKSGPRTLDLDLLLYGDQVIVEPGLTVPHPRMHQREFVLKPLAQVARQVSEDYGIGITHPVLGLTIESILNRLEA